MIIVVAGVEMGALLEPTTAIAGIVSPASLGIVIFWFIGLFAIRRAAKDPRWSVTMPGSQPGRRRRERAAPDQPHPYAGSSTAKVAALFGLASLVTLGAGVALEVSGNDLANRLGVNGVIFGATVLAAATALPEISSGIAAVRLPGGGPPWLIRPERPVAVENLVDLIGQHVSATDMVFHQTCRVRIENVPVHLFLSR